MPVILPDGTQVKQRQVDKSSTLNDNLPLLSYSSHKSLEDDLNYIRSVVKQLKGSIKYDSPLVRSLEDIREELENAVFHNATLTGTPVATTPPTPDDSDRIATTAYVSNKIDNYLSGQPGDKFYKYKDRVNQGSESEVWVVTHNMDKYPSVMVMSYATGDRELSMAKVVYLNRDQLEIRFSEPVHGVAYLN
jgi:hypothetical protein